MKSNLTTHITPNVVGGMLALAFTLATAASAQEIFRWVDKDGKVHYGDTLPPPAEVKTFQTKKLQDSVVEQEAVPYSVSIAMKNNPVTLYANSCGEACASAKTLLVKRGIPFTQKNPESDVAAAAALKALPDVPWNLMVGMRNLLIHDYDDVDPKRVWTDSQEDLPPLIAKLASYLATQPEKSGDDELPETT